MRHVGTAVIPGDGVGPEVVTATMAVLHAAAGRVGATLDIRELGWVCGNLFGDLLSGLAAVRAPAA